MFWPYWLGSELCLQADLAAEAVSAFGVVVRDVVWMGRSFAGRACQLLVSPKGDNWFDHEELALRAEAKHGSSGAACSECGRWRWMPLGLGDEMVQNGAGISRLLPDIGFTDPVVRSPERFGDGWMNYNELLFREDFADFLCRAADRRDAFRSRAFCFPR